jgi:hypothetical protein
MQKKNKSGLRTAEVLSSLQFIELYDIAKKVILIAKKKTSGRSHNSLGFT